MMDCGDEAEVGPAEPLLDRCEVSLKCNGKTMNLKTEMSRAAKVKDS